MVILSHSTSFLFPSSASLSNLETTLKSIFLLGSSGVDLFFAISGFLICSKILEREANKGHIDLKQFYARRIFRIFPLYYSYLFFLWALLQLNWLHAPVEQIVSSALFVQNYAISDGEWNYGLAHFWTLAVEEHFYLLFPLLLFLLPCSLKTRLVSLSLLIVSLTVWRYLEFRFQFVQPLLPSPSFFTRTDIRMDALLYGCAAAVAFRDPKIQLLLARSLSFSLLPFLLLGMFFFVQVVDVPLSLTIRNLSATFLILCTVLHANKHQWLENQILRLIGQMSFSLYVWNSFFLWPKDLPPASYLGFLQQPPLNLAALFLLAYVSHRFLERPFQRLGQRWFP